MYDAYIHIIHTPLYISLKPLESRGRTWIPSDVNVDALPYTQVMMIKGHELLSKATQYPPLHTSNLQWLAERGHGETDKYSTSPPPKPLPGPQTSPGMNRSLDESFILPVEIKANSLVVPDGTLHHHELVGVCMYRVGYPVPIQICFACSPSNLFTVAHAGTLKNRRSPWSGWSRCNPVGQEFFVPITTVILPLLDPHRREGPSNQTCFIHHQSITTSLFLYPPSPNPLEIPSTFF